jgi:hypothetical protein
MAWDDGQRHAEPRDEMAIALKIRKATVLRCGKEMREAYRADE